jgi:hypothetical protein
MADMPQHKRNEALAKSVPLNCKSNSATAGKKKNHIVGVGRQYFLRGANVENSQDNHRQQTGDCKIDHLSRPPYGHPHQKTRDDCARPAHVAHTDYGWIKSKPGKYSKKWTSHKRNSIHVRKANGLRRGLI